LSDGIQKLKWARPIKAHGEASARSLTGLEVAEQGAKKAEIEYRKQMQEDITEAVLNSPGCLLLPELPVLPQLPEESSPLSLPPSTTLAILCKGKEGRERKRISKGVIAKAEDCLSEP
jgi:hypothetical protein